MGYINKKRREEIKQKFDGLCAYSGTPLEDDWQVEHIKPLVRNWFDGTSMFPDAHCDENLVPVQKTINHYKGSLDLGTFRTWFLGGLHKRMDKPKNPRTEKSKRKKEYLNKVASCFGITPTKPFNGTFYFESIGNDGFDGQEVKDGKEYLKEHIAALDLADVISWVAVSERLPKIGEITDVYISAGHRVTNYKWEDHDLQSSFMPNEITHWIAIPEPPCV